VATDGVRMAELAARQISGGLLLRLSRRCLMACECAMLVKHHNLAQQSRIWQSWDFLIISMQTYLRPAPPTAPGPAGRDIGGCVLPSHCYLPNFLAQPVILRR
jgi:hypothetical protein